MRNSLRIRFALALGGWLLTVAGCGFADNRPPLERAQEFVRDGKWQEAIELCDAALSANSENAGAYACRGKAYLMLGNRNRAITDFSEAIRLAPQDPENYYQRAATYTEMGKKELARADEQTARKLDPMYAQSFLFQPEAPRDPRDLPEPSVAPADTTSSKSKSPQSKSALSKSGQSQFGQSPANHVPSAGSPGDGLAKRALLDREEIEQEVTARQIAALKQKPADFGQSTTLTDTSGQPIVVERRTMTEQLFGIDIQRPGESGSTATGRAVEAARSGRAAKRGAATDPNRVSGDPNRVLDDPNRDISDVPRLSAPLGPAGSPGQPGNGMAPRGGFPGGGPAQANSLGQPGYGLGGLPMQYPAHSPYINPAMRTTGLQDEDAQTRRSMSPYGPVTSPYAPTATGAYGARSAVGAGPMGGVGQGAGNPYSRPANPYAVGVPAGGRRELTGPAAGSYDPGP